jgi:alpha-ketoglutarate-dependent taurine dioxygenase
MTAALETAPHSDYGTGTLDGRPDGLPLVVRPGADAGLGRLCGWLRDNEEWVQHRLALHGAILFRGFAVRSARDFEALARAVDPELKNEYLGTSPRNALTSHVFTASELPSFFPIPQHCEMSFCRTPPRRVFFCALVPPEEGSGETPLADFRRVYRELDPELRKRFEEGGLRIVRNYAGPESGGGFDLWKLKRWDEMFLTTDRAAVEAKCREQGFEARWIGRDGLRLVSTQPVVREHPVTGEPVWHNHATTFHLSTAPGEYERITRYRPGLRTWALWQAASALVALQRRLRSADEQSMHCTYLDGSEIPDADMDAVRDAVWKHMVVFPWRRGDVVAIDNHSTSHGRLPYSGRREIAVAWA